MGKLKCAMIFVAVIFLSGCLYPHERKSSVQATPYQDQLKLVQSAVDEFQKANGGLLPIQTKDMSTPLYQKYPIDFNRLAPRYMAEPPSTAYESGGDYQYVLVDVENNPTVKLIDVKMAEKIRDIKLRVQMYRQEHKYPPYQDVLARDLFTLDGKKLGEADSLSVTSPISGNSLPLMIDGDGEIYADYRTELVSCLKKSKKTFKPGTEIQDIIWEETPFVPAFSVKYTVNDKQEPVFLEIDIKKE
ncbi:ABC transporter periplasmic binding protein yphF [Paraburkholderia tropica]